MSHPADSVDIQDIAAWNIWGLMETYEVPKVLVRSKNVDRCRDRFTFDLLFCS